MILSLILFSACFTSTILGHKLHEHMTKREIRSVFNVDHDSIHNVEYEVVPIFHNNSGLQREKRQIQLRAFNKQYSLSLESNDDVLLGSNTKVFVPIVNNGVLLRYEKRPYPAVNLQLYHDMNNRAAIALYTDDDSKVHVHGTIGDGIVLRPLPSRVRREVLSKFPNTYPMYERSSSDEAIYHVAMKLNQRFSSVDKITNSQYESALQPQIDGLNRHITQVNYYVENNPIDYVKRQSIENNINSLNNKIALLNPGHPQGDLLIKTINNLISQTRQLLFDVTSNLSPNPNGNVPNTGSGAANVPNTGSNGGNVPSTGPVETVYPELLVVVDYYTYNIHGNSIEKVAVYAAAFWNAVDLRYRELNDPKVRLNIAGLVITPQLGTHDFFERHSYHECTRGVYQDDTKTDAIDYLKTLDETAKYFHRHNSDFPKGTYDMIVGMTARRLCKYNTQSRDYEYAVGVAASVGGACGYDQNLDVTIFHDIGAFGGILTAAHELGHLLGAPHDRPDEIEIYDPELSRQAQGGSCDWNKGYMMSYVKDSPNQFHWSYCSKTLIQRFLKSDKAECLKNKPNVGRPQPKILPGKLFSRNDQCQKIMKRNAYAGDDPTYLYSCVTLYCETTSEDQYNRIKHHEISANNPTADGTSCGNSRICFGGECVDANSVQL